MNDDIKYCATAFIDLLGFSGHLDVSSNDLRTNIGQEAIKRLDFLENSLSKIESEIQTNKDFFPDFFNAQRINDSLIITIDLPDFLKPSIGESFKNGIRGDEFDKYFDIEKLLTIEAAMKAYSEKIDESIDSLFKFVGMVSRIHNFINKQENKSYFPGAKTIISTGYRKTYKNRAGNEDFLAANFSFSNAYKADQFLHGAKLFIDCYILQLLSNNCYSRNIVKSAVFIGESKPLDPFIETEDYLMLHNELKESVPVLLNLFHKPYYFREINPKRSSYLQIVPALSAYLKANHSHVNSVKVFGLSFSYIVSNRVDQDSAKKAFLFYSDLDDSIKTLYDLILFGQSEDTNKGSSIMANYIDWRK